MLTVKKRDQRRAQTYRAWVDESLTSRVAVEVEEERGGKMVEVDGRKEEGRKNWERERERGVVCIEKREKGAET
jgi:hypothetical protein